MAAVLKHAGFQTRQIGLYSVPVQGNHVTGEVKIKDQWVFIDPTTGIYFEDRNGNPLSLSEIRSLWPSGGAIGKVSTLPHATGTPANIWAINPYEVRIP